MSAERTQQLTLQDLRLNISFAKYNLEILETEHNNLPWFRLLKKHQLKRKIYGLKNKGLLSDCFPTTTTINHAMTQANRRLYIRE